MAHYRVSESKREQFRRYLEKAGVIDSLTNVLVALYEETEKPNNALERNVKKRPTRPYDGSERTPVSGFYKETQKYHAVITRFIKHQLGVGPEADDAESLRLELNNLQQKYEQLLEENKELRSRLLQYEPPQDAGTE